MVEADIKHQKEVDERKQDKEESVVIMYLDTLYCLFFFLKQINNRIDFYLAIDCAL